MSIVYVQFQTQFQFIKVAVVEKKPEISASLVGLNFGFTLFAKKFYLTFLFHDTNSSKLAQTVSLMINLL